MVTVPLESADDIVITPIGREQVSHSGAPFLYWLGRDQRRRAFRRELRYPPKAPSAGLSGRKTR